MTTAASAPPVRRQCAARPPFDRRSTAVRIEVLMWEADQPIRNCYPQTPEGEKNGNPSPAALGKNSKNISNSNDSNKNNNSNYNILVLSHNIILIYSKRYIMI